MPPSAPESKRENLTHPEIKIDKSVFGCFLAGVIATHANYYIGDFVSKCKMKFVHLIFDDKRLAITIVIMWMVVVVGSLNSLNVMHSEFMTFGPSNHTKFLTVTINTWTKWGMLSTATFLNTCISDFMSDAISPWIQNTIQDHKAKYLPYRKFTCYLICQLWTVYCSVMGIFNVFLLMSQIDFLLVRLLADLIVSTITIYKFTHNKIVDRAQYYIWGEEKLAYVQMRHEGELFDLQKETIQPLNQYINRM